MINNILLLYTNPKGSNAFLIPVGVIQRNVGETPTIAEKVNKDPTTITRITNSLSKKGYITKITEQRGRIKKCIYRLNL